MLMCVSAGLFAQEQPARPERPKMKSPEERAEATAGRMREEVGLTDKQYKKVYKHFLKDYKYRQELAEEAFADKMPQGGPGMGGPGMGGPGGPGMGPGGPGMGGSGMGPGMGRPDGNPPARGEAKEGERPQRPEGMNPFDSLVSDEYLEKQEMKLKKILSEEQYAQWRQKHPSEQHELPPLEFKTQEK